MRQQGGADQHHAIRGLALAPYGINVNSVAPGVVVTPMWEQLDVDYGRAAGVEPGESMAAFITKIPLKRPQIRRPSRPPSHSCARPKRTTSRDTR